MSRKHFEAIAAALRASKPNADLYPNDYPSMNAQWIETVYQIADALATLNEQFNRERFLAACSMPEVTD